MPTAFISYRRDPSTSLAHLLQKDLQSQYRFDIYLDTNRIDGAKVQFPERLLSAIDASDVFICLLADTTLDSEWVLREIQQACDGQKPCIPVFQESYQPRAIDNAAVDYLLSFDGVQVLDKRGLYIDESVQQIGTIIRNTLPQRRRTAFYLVPLALLLVVGMIAAIVLLNNGNDDDRQSATAFFLTQAAQKVAFRNSQDTATIFSLTQVAQETAFRGSQASQQTEIRDSQDTVTSFSLTQAFQKTADENSTRMRDELQTTQTTWTLTPTSTPTPTATFTASPTPTATTSLSPIELAKTPVAHNDDWATYGELDSQGVEMVLVPAGCFMMGSEDGEDDESPVYEQCFDEPFWIDRYEVTNEQYGSVGCSSYSSEPDQPRNCVSWFAARRYCESRGGRLPTEREWEYAARGPDNLVYPWGDTYDVAFVIGEDDPTYGNLRTAMVGSHPEGVSWVGALDMSGNVWEWTSSVAMGYPYVATDGREDLNSTGSRVLRGGSFLSPSNILRADYSIPSSPDYEFNYFGFRCARSID